jgi:hypothetical protein
MKQADASLQTLTLGGLLLKDLLKEPMNVPSPGPWVHHLTNAGKKRVRELSPPRPVQEPSPINQSLTRKARRKKRYHKNRQAVRQEAAAAWEADVMPVYKPASFIPSRYGRPDFIPLPFNANTLPTARSTFVGKSLKKNSADMGKVFTLTELKERGIAIIEWDGM